MALEVVTGRAGRVVSAGVRQAPRARYLPIAEHGLIGDLHTIALVGGKRGKLADIADQAIVINSTHYGRVEDAHMGICHMLCYVFMENPQLVEQG